MEGRHRRAKVEVEVVQNLAVVEVGVDQQMRAH